MEDFGLSKEIVPSLLLTINKSKTSVSNVDETSVQIIESSIFTMTTSYGNKQDVATDAPKREDVLFCRGSLVNKHFGNVRLCALVRDRAVEYVTSNYADAKEMILRQMVEELTEDGGRFLEEARNGMWEKSNRMDILDRIKAVFEEYTSTIGTDLSRRSDSSSSRMSSPCSPPGNQCDRRSPPKTVTPPELSPRSITLRRRDILPPVRGFGNFPLQSPGLSAQRPAQAPTSMLESDRSLELARMIFLQKQNERRRLLHALRQHESSGMGTPSSLIRTASAGKRRQIDPLAPHRKRKTPRTNEGSSLGR